MSEVKPSEEQLNELRANKTRLEQLEQDMTKAELAGIDMSANRAENKKALENINKILSVYGS